MQRPYGYLLMQLVHVQDLPQGGWVFTAQIDDDPYRGWQIPLYVTPDAIDRLVTAVRYPAPQELENPTQLLYQPLLGTVQCWVGDVLPI
jgi:hypothetical protein